MPDRSAATGDGVEQLFEEALLRSRCRSGGGSCSRGRSRCRSRCRSLGSGGSRSGSWSRLGRGLGGSLRCSGLGRSLRRSRCLGAGGLGGRGRRLGSSLGRGGLRRHSLCRRGLLGSRRLGRCGLGRSGLGWSLGRSRRLGSGLRSSLRSGFRCRLGRSLGSSGLGSSGLGLGSRRLRCGRFSRGSLGRLGSRRLGLGRFRHHGWFDSSRLGRFVGHRLFPTPQVVADASVRIHASGLS